MQTNPNVIAKVNEAIGLLRDARKMLPKDPKRQTPEQAWMAWYCENGVTRLKRAIVKYEGGED
jgi:hypothetical protein